MRGIRQDNEQALLSSLLSSYISDVLEYLKREEHHEVIYQRIFKTAQEHDRIAKSKNREGLLSGIKERIRRLWDGDEVHWQRFIAENEKSVYYKEILSVQKQIKERIRRQNK